MMTALAAPTSLQRAAECAAGSLPSLAGWSFAAVPAGTAPPQPGGATAVVADLGAAGRLVLVVASALARAVQVGPPPTDDVVDGLDPALRAAAAAVGSPVADLVQRGADLAVLAEYGEVMHAVKLLDGDEHMATLVLIAPELAVSGDETGDGRLSIDTAAVAAASPAMRTHLDMLGGVELSVTAELGRTRMLMRDVLALLPGSVIELDRAAGSPVDLLVNGTLIARGEVVVVDEEYGVRITEVVGTGDDARPGQRS